MCWDCPRVKNTSLNQDPRPLVRPGCVCKWELIASIEDFLGYKYWAVVHGGTCELCSLNSPEAREKYLKQRWGKMTEKEKEKAILMAKGKGYCIQHFTCIMIALNL
jgi:hypothetical protein